MRDLETKPHFFWINKTTHTITLCLTFSPHKQP